MTQLQKIYKLTQTTLFEALYVLQIGKFYNRIYNFRVFLSSMYVLSAVYTTEYNWCDELRNGLESFWHFWQMPGYLLGKVGSSPLPRPRPRNRPRAVREPAINTQRPGGHYARMAGQFAVFAAATGWLVAVIVLAVIVGNGVVNSSMHLQGSQTTLRSLLGFGVTFWITPMRIWLSWVDCDYFCDLSNRLSKLSDRVLPGTGSAQSCTPTNLVFKEDFELHMCYGGSVMIALGVTAFICVALHFIVLLFGALMHVNDPRSWSSAARPHSWVDIMHIMTAYPIIFATVLLNGRLGELLGVSILLSRAFLAVFTIVLQPFYSTDFTDFRAALFMGEAWSGLALLIISASKSKASVAFTVASLALYVVFSLIGFFLSKLFRRYIFGVVKKEYKDHFIAVDVFHSMESAQRTSKDAGGQEKAKLEEEKKAQKLVEDLEQDNDKRRTAIWQIITEEFIPGLSKSPRQWFIAVLTEVKTRFILEGKTNKLPHVILIDIAENIYLTALKDNVQSTYLQLQYIIFLSAYRQNFAQSKLKLEDVSRTGKVNLGLQYSIFRKRKDLDRLQQEHESQAQDSQHVLNSFSTGYEEMQKREAATTAAYDLCRERLLTAWKAVGQLQKLKVAGQMQQRMDDVAERLTGLLELAADSERKAQNGFIFILDKCEEAETVYRRYALFLREIQKDLTFSQYMLDTADALQSRALLGESKSQASASGTSRGSSKAEQKRQLRRPLSVVLDSSVVWLQMKLRVASVLLAAAVIALFACYITSVADYQTSLISLTESSTTRIVAMQTLVGARRMHIAAVQHRQTRIAQTNAESEKVDRGIQEAAKEADVLMALTKFSQAWDGIGRAQTEELQRAYIEQNPYPAGQRSSLLKAAGSLLYHNVHEQFHPMLREMKVRLRLYDSYLLDIRGNVVYSVEKELDFAVNVGSGSLKASALGRAFAASMRIPQEKQVIDYEPYEPKKFALAKFVSQAISSRGGQVVGVLCFQLDSERTLEEIKLEFNEAGKYVQSATDMLWLAHNNLAFVYKATLPEIKAFYEKPHSEVILKYPNPNSYKKYRAIAVSAGDAGWRLITSAREMLHQPFELFEKFDKRYPESNIPLSFVLENAMMIVRALDQCTALYQLEALYIAVRLRVVFIILAAIAGGIEVFLIVGIYRVAIKKQFDSLNAAIVSLGELSSELVSSQVHQLIASISKAKKARKASANVQQTEESDDDSLSSDSEASHSESEEDLSDADESDGESKGSKTSRTSRSATAKEKKRKEAQSKVGRADKGNEVTSQTTQKLVLAVVYYLCLFFIWICLVVLCFLCIRVINLAEVAAGEINNSGRRSFLVERVAYLSDELVHSGPTSVIHDETLLGGDLTWLSSREIIRCQLDRSILALLSVHYALLYGKAAGWIDMAQGFERGPVREWGSQGSTDMCSPFTWDTEAFAVAVQLGGSLGRYEPQDSLLFKSVCLSELPEADVKRTADLFVNPRLKPHTAPLLQGRQLCSLFRQRCRFLNVDQHASLSPAEKRIRYASTTNFLNMPDMDVAYSTVPQCSAEGTNTTRANRRVPRPDPCPQVPYPVACYFRNIADTEEEQCKCKGGEVSPEGCVAEPGQERDFRCPDAMASSGLHNYLVVYSEHARGLLAVPDAGLADGQVDYRFVMDYKTPELILGLSATTFLYLHEAIFTIVDSTIITEVGFAIMLAIIIVQYNFLKRRFSQLSKKHAAIRRIVKRFLGSEEDLKRENAKHRASFSAASGKLAAPLAVMRQRGRRSTTVDKPLLE